LLSKFWKHNSRIQGIILDNCWKTFWV